MKRITIDPITRLEGHGKIEIFLKDDGDVENVYFQVPELRGFEKFCEGRPVEELAQIVTKICGVCPGCHHMASGKAADAVYGVEPPPTAKKIRELFYMAHFVHSHIAHFYALAAPDFVCGPTAPAAERNILGVINKVGVEIGTEVIKQRRIAQEIQALLGGHQTHVVLNIPGGVRKGLTEDQRKDIEEKAKGFIEFAKFSLKLFNDVVLANKTYVDIIVNGPYSLNLHSMGLVDENNKVNFYDGKVRVVDTKGKELYKYSPKDYTEFIAAPSEDIIIKNLLNYPNPFTTSTSFYFEHNQPSAELDVLIQVFTVSGKLVKTIESQITATGYRCGPFVWDGLDDFGSRIGRGVYIYRLKVRTNSGKTIEKFEKLVIL